MVELHEAAARLVANPPLPPPPLDDLRRRATKIRRRRTQSAVGAFAAVVVVVAGVLGLDHTADDRVKAAGQAQTPPSLTQPNPYIPGPFGPATGPVTVVASGAIGYQRWQLVVFDSHLGHCELLQDPSDPAKLQPGSGGCGTTHPAGPAPSVCLNSFGFGFAQIGAYDFVTGDTGADIATIEIVTTTGTLSVATVPGSHSDIRYYAVPLPQPDHSDAYLGTIDRTVTSIIALDRTGTPLSTATPTSGEHAPSCTVAPSTTVPPPTTPMGT